MDTQTAPDILADHKANRSAALAVIAFTFLSFLILATSDFIEAARALAPAPGLAPWIIQGSSHIAILAVMPIIPYLLTRFPVNIESWSRAVPVWMLGFVIYGGVHVLLMVALREMAWPIAIGGHYDFGLTDPMVWIYELRKDLYTFLLVTGVFWCFQHIEHLKLAARARHDEAEGKGHLTLTSGGHIFRVKSQHIEVGVSASNYVEITTPGKTFLARLTMGELERLLDAAGGEHIRIHRSHIVHRDQIEEVIPRGDGSAQVRLKSGEALIASRTYRARLNSALNIQNLNAILMCDDLNITCV